ncbi:MAG: hypothetical protein ACP5XB_11820 [Isosphaeraceae bacterium]
MIADGFDRCSKEIRAGIDPDANVVCWKNFEAVPEGVQMEIVFTAARREDAIGMADVLARIGSDWEQLVRMLAPVPVVSS